MVTVPPCLLYDGWRRVQDYKLDGTWKSVREYIWGGTYIDELLAFSDDTDADGLFDDAGGSERYLVCQQANFNAVAVVKASTAAIVEKITYDPYGEADVDVQPSQSATGNVVLFQGREWDDDADLYYFRNRWLSPRLGRFMQRDPVGYEDGMNLYEAMLSNPGTYLDPTGSIIGTWPGAAWICRLKEHKTAWHGHERRIYIGPRAQRVLAPFLLGDPSAYCFSPTEAEAERRERLHDERTTPLSCGNVPGSNRKDDPERTAGERCTTDSYRRAIARACDHAFPPPEPLAKREDETIAEWQARLTPEQKKGLATWQKARRWHPHQLRHNAATELRKEFGIEAASIPLGHRSPAITELYAEQDEQQAIEAIMKVG